MNDSDTEFFENDEIDYKSGYVANTSDILVSTSKVHSLSSGSPSFNYPVCSKSKSATLR